MRFLYINATITSGIKLNNLHVKLIESIQVSCIAQVPPSAIWLRCQWNKVYSMLDCACTYDKSSSDAEKRLTMVASFVPELHWRLMPLCDDHHTSSLTYWLCWKGLNQGRKSFNAQFSILDDEKTQQPCRNTSSS